MVITQKHTPGLPADGRDLSGCAPKPTTITVLTTHPLEMKCALPIDALSIGLVR